MTKFVVLLLALALVQTGWALKCYNCQDKSCDDKTKIGEEMCLPAPAGQEVMCLTEITKNKANSEMSTMKKCVFATIGQKYGCVSVPGHETTQCDTCNSDLCNKSGADKMVLGPMVIFAFVAAYLVPKFF